MVARAFFRLSRRLPCHAGLVAVPMTAKISCDRTSRSGSRKSYRGFKRAGVLRIPASASTTEKLSHEYCPLSLKWPVTKISTDLEPKWLKPRGDSAGRGRGEDGARVEAGELFIPVRAYAPPFS